MIFIPIYAISVEKWAVLFFNSLRLSSPPDERFVCIESLKGMVSMNSYQLSVISDQSSKLEFGRSQFGWHPKFLLMCFDQKIKVLSNWRFFLGAML